MDKRHEEILEGVKENISRLKGCSKHKFIKPDQPWMMKLIPCEHCGGVMRLTDIGRYIEGYKAAGGNPNDIMEGFE